MSGCQNPVQSPVTADPGTGTVSLAIAQGLGRTILPELPSGGFDGFKAVFTYYDDNTVYETGSWTTDSGNIELAAGHWTLVVTGLIGGEPAAMSLPISINVVANQGLSRDVQLFPIEDPYQKGTFAWDITLAQGIELDAIRIYDFDDLDDYLRRLVSPYYDLEDDEIELAPGRYLVVFELSGAGGTLEISEVLHIYANLTSTFEPEYPLNVEFPSALLDLIADAWTGTDFGTSGIAVGHFALSPLSIVGICDGNFDEIKAQFAALLYEDGLDFPRNPGYLAELVDAALLGIAAGDPAFTNVPPPFDEDRFEELIAGVLVNTGIPYDVDWNNLTASVTIGVHTVQVTFSLSEITFSTPTTVNVVAGVTGSVGIVVHNIGSPDVGTTVQFADVVTLYPENPNVTISGAIFIRVDGSGENTLVLAVAAGTPASEHEATIGIGGVSATFTLIIKVPPPPESALVVSAGIYHTAMIRANGSLWTWGRSQFGQLGIGTSGNQVHETSPVPVGTATNWAYVSAGRFHTVAITTSGELWAWGDNRSRQLGDSSITGVNALTPSRIGDRTDWKTVSAGDNHTLAITTGGHLYGWGSSLSGQLGNGQTTDNIDTPTRIGIRSDWAMVSAHTGHTMAITTEGHLYGWGQNRWGPIGNGTQTGVYATPVRVRPNETWATVSAGFQHTVAITVCGQMWAWGNNGSGQVGDGDTTFADSRSPTRIGDHSIIWDSVSAASGHTVAITRCGQKWSWGDGGQGRLGTGNTGWAFVPARIGDRDDWAAVSTMGSHTMAITECGELWAWGFNAHGRLGDGTATQRTTPVRIIPGP